MSTHDDEKNDGKVRAANDSKDYEMVPPDGGWGYLVIGAMVMVFNATIMPLVAFGIIYGKFLQTIGDETKGTTLSNAVFNTLSAIMGPITNGLLGRYSCRQVGFVGSIVFCTGAIAMIFVSNLSYMLTFFGIFQGLGAGLLLPSIIKSVNQYFDKKLNLMMSVAQTFMVLFSMAAPGCIVWSMNTIGFRGTLIVLAVWGSMCFPSVACLDPVEKHMKKVFKLDAEADPLMVQAKANGLHSLTRSRQSIVSLEGRVANVNTTAEVDDKIPFWQNFIRSMELQLLKSPRYLNISLGLSFVFMGDVLFISIIPLMLNKIGFTDKNVALTLAVYFGADLVGRLVLTALLTRITFNNRLMILFAAILIVVGRIAFSFNNFHLWRIATIGLLGYLRSFIQTCYPLVFADAYGPKFPAAFGLNSAINGVTSILMGNLMNVVGSYFGADMVGHLLTGLYVLTIVGWSVELIFFRSKKESGGGR